MKLKNKKTGEVKDWDFGNWYQTILNPENKEKYECNLNDFIDRTVKFREEWEDYKEDKRYWYIDVDGEVMSKELGWFNQAQDNIGNRFDTREEAELAVRKLKAWKRLEDKGFSFEGYDDGYKHDFNSGHIEFYVENDGDVLNDIDLLFCPKENS